MSLIPHHLEYGFSAEAKGTHAPLIKQVHGTSIVTLDAGLEPTPVPESDAVSTRDFDFEIYVFTADCLPVLLATESIRGPVAAVHAGWRGAMGGVVKTSVEALNTDAVWIHAILGPCLLKCCFEVKKDFIETFTKARGKIDEFLESRDGKTYFDMVKFVMEKELSQVPRAQIHTDAVRCTFCSQPQLPSFRRNGFTDPQIRSWILKTSSQIA